jgi:hypothetical protein
MLAYPPTSKPALVTPSLSRWKPYEGMQLTKGMKYLKRSLTPARAALALSDRGWTVCGTW